MASCFWQLDNGKTQTLVNMQPSNYRQLSLNVGTKLGLLGDFEMIPAWKPKHLIEGVLKSYLVVERHHNFYTHKEDINPTWDAAIIMSLDMPLTIVDAKTWDCNRVLLIHRYPDVAWDKNDPTVHVFALPSVELFNQEPISKDRWFAISTWLEATAVMTVEDTLDPSEISILLKTKKNTGDLA
jgi:hypothetical protein